MDLHEFVAPFAEHLGAWSGSGRGYYPTIDGFEYNETLTFTGVPDKPFVKAEQKTASPTGAPITRSIHDTAAAHPTWPAITSENCTLTYRELARESPRIIAAARHLQEGVRLAGRNESEAQPVTAVCTTSAFEAARIMAALAATRQAPNLA